jgi:serine/threonine-protein kinase
VVAYHALTGVRPFEGVTLGELCVAIKRGEVTPPTRLRNDLGPDIDAWFARALHRDPEGRFQSAKDMAQAIEQAVGMSTTMGSTPSMVAAGAMIATFPGTALSTPPGTRARRTARRALLLLGAGAVVAGAVAVGAVLVGRSGGAAEPTAGAAVSAAATGAPTAVASGTASAVGTGRTDGGTGTARPDDGATAVVAVSSAPVADGSSAPRVGPVLSIPPLGPASAPPRILPGSSSGDERSKRAGEQLGI